MLNEHILDYKATLVKPVASQDNDKDKDKDNGSAQELDQEKRVVDDPVLACSGMPLEGTFCYWFYFFYARMYVRTYVHTSLSNAFAFLVLSSYQPITCLQPPTVENVVLFSISPGCLTCTRLEWIQQGLLQC